MENFFHLVQSVGSGYLVPDGIGKYQVMDGIRKVDGSLPFESRLEGLDSNSIFILKITNVYDTAVSSSGDISKLLK